MAFLYYSGLRFFGKQRIDAAVGFGVLFPRDWPGFDSIYDSVGGFFGYPFGIFREFAA